MEYRVLGPLQVREGEESLSLGGGKQRALLAFLLLNANRPVSRERLIDALWGDDPPERAVTALQVYVSRLRKRLPPDALVTQAPGYVLRVGADELDLEQFDRLRAEGRPHEALALWQGPALAEFDEPFARAEAARLADLRLAVLEDRVASDLEQGRQAELVGELETLVAENPHRERLRAQLMLALYRSHRQVDALAAYRDARAALDELGLEPSAELRRLEHQILTHDPALDPKTEPPADQVTDVRLPGPLRTASAFPFVGRAAELSTLEAALERAVGGAGTVVLVTGEPGGGKTRLVRELAQQAAESGVVVCYGTSDAAVTVPYQPLLEWFEFLQRTVRADVLRSAVAPNKAALAHLLPGIAAAAADAAPPDRFRLQSAVIDTLRLLAAAQPLLLVLEDVHWADAETLVLLVRLARTAPEARMLVCATFRQPGEEIRADLRETLAQLARLDVPRVPLDNLSTEEVATFVRRSTDADGAAGLLEAIGALTDGTPLLVCELWRELVAGGAVSVEDGVASLTRPVSEIRGPRRIHELIEQRLARLPPATAAMVELASVAGPRFELRVVATAAALARSELAAAVELTVADGIIEELPATVPACRFTHELIRRSIYDRIPRVRLPELHLRVGEALEHLDASDADLAYHFTLAAPVDGPARAVRYNLRAADAARESVAYDAAIACMSTALELGIDDPREHARVQTDLGYLLHESGRVAESMAVWAASAAAATTLEERGLALRALVDSAQAQLYSDPVGRSAELMPVAEQAIATFTDLGDRRGLATAERLYAEALGREQRHAEGFAALDRALEHAAAIGDHVIRRDVIGQIARRVCDGPTRATEAIERLEALRRIEDDPVHDAGMRRCLAFALAMDERFDDARRLLEASAVPPDHVDRTSFSFSSHWMAFRARQLTGDVAGAELELIGPFRQLRGGRGDEPESRAMRMAALLALLYEDQERWDDAADYLAYGAEVDRSAPAKGKIYTPLRLAARARLALHEGRGRDALEIAESAVDAFGRGEWFNDIAPAWLALAEARRACGRSAEADAAFAAAMHLYEAKGNRAAIALLTARTRTA